jgi:hypothetical protein
MSIESGGGGQGENTDVPKPPEHNQSSDEDRARRDAIRPFKLYKDAKSPTNWMLEAEVEGYSVRTYYSAGINTLTREEFIERIRKGIRIDKEHRARRNPEQGSEPNQ